MEKKRSGDQVRDRSSKMESIISPPTLTKKKSYEQFKVETLAWAQVTDLNKEKNAIAVALNLLDYDEHKISERVFDVIELDDLKSENGLSILLILDKHLANDELTVFWRSLKTLMILKGKMDKQSMNT